MNALQPRCTNTRMASDPQMQVADHYAGPVAAFGFFRQRSMSLFATTAQTSCCTRVGMRTCGRANIVIAGIRSEGDEDIQERLLPPKETADMKKYTYRSVNSNKDRGGEGRGK